MLQNNKKKVFVGLSGGVDSSVSALLLKNAGYDVTGVFIRGWQPDWIPCTWKTDRISAMRTAAHLEIAFITLDLENQYKDKVVTYLLEEYSKGNTPNPDMLCNREIKFGDFLKWSIKNGADFIATGHYAVVHTSSGSTSHLPEGKDASLREADRRSEGVVLIESADKEKDQSYFLSQLTQNELTKIIFPIGHLQKSEVRKIASENNLPVATRKDSQGICFVGDLEMSEFLKKELNPTCGDVLDTKGKVIGQHEGAILYTIGQRHGFEITENSSNRRNLYVVNKNLANNTITVSSKEEKSLENKSKAKDTSAVSLEQRIEIRNYSFTENIDSIKNAGNLLIRIRYRGEKFMINYQSFDENSKTIIISTDSPLEFARGQFAVLYDDEKCLGGGEM